MTEYTDDQKTLVTDKVTNHCISCQHFNTESGHPQCDQSETDLIQLIIGNNSCPEGEW